MTNILQLDPSKLAALLAALRQEQARINALKQDRDTLRGRLEEFQADETAQSTALEKNAQALAASTKQVAAGKADRSDLAKLTEKQTELRVALETTQAVLAAVAEQLSRVDAEHSGNARFPNAGNLEQQADERFCAGVLDGIREDIVENVWPQLVAARMAHIRASGRRVLDWPVFLSRVIFHVEPGREELAAVDAQLDALIGGGDKCEE